MLKRKQSQKMNRAFRLLNLTVLMTFLASLVLSYGINVSATATWSLNEPFDASPFVPGYNLPTIPTTAWRSLGGGTQDSTVAEASGGNSIKLTTATTATGGSSNIRLISPDLTLAVPSSGLVVLETMLKYGPNSIQSIATIGIKYTNGSNSYYNYVGFRVNGGLNNTYFKATNGKNTNVVSNLNSTYNTDQWYNFKIVMNPSTSMYDVYIDGTKQNTSLLQMTWYSTALAASNPYIGSTITSVTANLYSGANLASNYMNVDNIKLYTTNVTALSMSTSTAMVQTGGTYQLSVTPTGGTPDSIVWTSSNTNIATVDNNGLVTGVSEGTATITATADGIPATCSVTVGKAVTGITLNKSTTTLSITNAETETLTATVLPLDATNKNVTWSSDNTSVATVDSIGKVTAVAQGTANITVTTQDGAKTDSCAVTVSTSLLASNVDFSGTDGTVFPTTANGTLGNYYKYVLGNGQSILVADATATDGIAANLSAYNSSSQARILRAIPNYSGNIVTVETKAKLHGDNTVNARFWLTHSSSANNANHFGMSWEGATAGTVNSTFATQGHLFAPSGVKDVMLYNTDIWYRIKLVMDTSRGVYDMYVAEEGGEYQKKLSQKYLTGANLTTNPYSSGYFTSFNMAYITANTTSVGSMSVDYVNISTNSVSSLSLDKSTETIQKGSTITLVATSDLSGAPIGWSSNNTVVATVDQNGIVTARYPGIATITTMCSGHTATCTITVPGVAVGSIEFKDDNNQIVSQLSPNSYIKGVTTASNYDSVAKDATIIIALYDINNKLIQVNTSNINLTSGQMDGLLNVGFTLPASVADCYTKVYAWNTISDLTPLLLVPTQLPTN